MRPKRVTLIVSDLHMGDGRRRATTSSTTRISSRNFVRAQAATAGGHDGQIEFIINGDFLEFVQVFRMPTRRLIALLVLGKQVGRRSSSDSEPDTLKSSRH